MPSNSERELEGAPCINYPLSLDPPRGQTERTWTNTYTLTDTDKRTYQVSAEDAHEQLLAVVKCAEDLRSREGHVQIVNQSGSLVRLQPACKHRSGCSVGTSRGRGCATFSHRFIFDGRSCWRSLAGSSMSWYLGHANIAQRNQMGATLGADIDPN